MPHLNKIADRIARDLLAASKANGTTIDIDTVHEALCAAPEWDDLTDYECDYLDDLVLRGLIEMVG